MTTESPPTYVHAPSSYDDTPPTYYYINGQKLNPTISPADLKGHLALLHGFSQLRNKVEDLTNPVNNGNVKPFPFLPTEKERKWSWFVGLAVERFTIWVSSPLWQDDDFSHLEAQENVLPPLDVLMVLHAYLLNPWAFQTDHERVFECRFLMHFADMFGLMLQDGIERIMLSEESPERIEFWANRTQIPYDAFDYAKSYPNKNLKCPRCNSHFSIPFMSYQGYGYLQSEFQINCDICNLKIDKELLGLVKCAKDMAAPATQPNFHLAGTFAPYTRFKPQEGRTRGMKYKMLAPFHPRGTQSEKQKEPNPQDILKSVNYDNERFWSRCGTIEAVTGRLARIRASYFDDKPFSVELVGAVLRQGSFTSKMYGFGWTEPKHFDIPEEERALVHCIARYHAFLDLISLSPGSFYVPSLDIDLAWHTHQLMPTRYKNDCVKYIDRFIDHNDKVVESVLSTSFDITCRAWQERFGSRYTHCGCPVPGSTIGQRLSRMIISSETPFGNPKSSYLAPPSDRDDLAAATHPSDHNAVFLTRLTGWLDASRVERNRKYLKRVKREQNEAEKNVKKKKEWAVEEVVDAYRRRELGHYTPAFMVPVPMYFYGHMAGCSANTSAVISSGGGDVVVTEGSWGGGDSGSGSSGACGGGGGGGGGGGDGGGDGGGGGE